MKYYVEIENGWKDFFRQEENKQYFQEVLFRVKEEYKTKKIYPTKDKIFNAFIQTDLKDVKVLLLGQDPYHQPGQAMGLSFSVPAGVQFPPSLKNIYAELESDLGRKSITCGDLTPWAKQGVMCLNTVLTVEESKPNLHKMFGWLNFTLEVIKKLSEKGEVVFILWGANAISYEKYIDKSKNRIVKSVHPSPLSAYNGFFGSKPFSKTNAYLKEFGKTEIDW